MGTRTCLVAMLLVQAALAPACFPAPPDLFYRAARADGFGNVPYWHQGHDYGYPQSYRLGWVAPSAWESHPYYTPPLPPYVPRSGDERLAEMRSDAGRALELGQFPRALARFRGARDLASRLYGPRSEPAREARVLLWQTEYELWLRGGGGDPRDHSRALASGDRALDRGDLPRAEVGFHDALLRAESRQEAAVARERLAELRALRRAQHAADATRVGDPREEVGRPARDLGGLADRGEATDTLPADRGHSALADSPVTHFGQE